MNAILRIVLMIIGIGLMIGGGGVFGAAATALIYGLVHGAYVVGTKLFPVGAEQTAILICGFVAAAIIAMLLILLGVTVARRKRVIAGWVWAALFGTLIVAGALGGALGFDTGSAIRDHYQSLKHTRVVPVADFQQIKFVSDNMFYDVEPGPSNAVLIKTLGNVDVSKIKVSLLNGVLTVDGSQFHPSESCNFICPYGQTNTQIVIQTTSDPNLVAPRPVDPRPAVEIPYTYDYR